MEEWSKIIDRIELDEFTYISFDIFDTLLLRPFWEPTDLFFFTGIMAKQLGFVKKEIDFIHLRKNAESQVRLKAGKEIQDINLDEIYGYMNEKITRTEDIELLKQNEKDMELLFCYRRNSGYQLYKRAMESGKKLLCISDMYLQKSEICNLLKKNEYGFDKIYLSSEIRLGKYTGDLYQYVQKDLNLQTNEKILHIGDNYKADVVKAKENGFASCYLPKAKDMYIKDKNADNPQLLESRIKKGIEANLIWDNPFIKADGIQCNEVYLNVFRNYLNTIESCNDKFLDKKQSHIIRVIKRLLNN